MNNFESKTKNKSVISEKEARKLCDLMTKNEETFVSYELGPYSEEHIGSLGSHRKLLLLTKCKDSKVKTYSFFVKAVPYENPKEAAYCFEKCVFQQETTFFSEILPLLIKDVEIDKWAPTCYLAKSDTVVLEDLGLQGYSMQGAILDKEFVKSALSTVAHLHATSVLAEARLGKKFIELYPDEFREMTYLGSGKSHNWCTSGINSAIAVANSLGLNSSKIMFLYERLLKLTKSKNDKLINHKHSVISHGDLWSNNMMFNNDKHCVLVDFQFVRYTSLAQDVMILLYLSTTREFRAKYEAEMIRFYYAELTETIKKNNPLAKVLSFEELMTEIEEQRLRAVVSGVIYSSSVNLNKKLAPEIFEDLEEYDKFTYGDRNAKLLELMQRDQTYRNRVEESVRDIVEFGEKWKSI